MINNKKLQNFKKITLQNNTNKNITLKGKQILKLINDILEDETKKLYKDIEKLIDKEIYKAEQNEFTYIWGGKPMSKIKFEKIKKDMLIQITGTLEKYGKKNKLL